jgi:hypothetical protein
MLPSIKDIDLVRESKNSIIAWSFYEHGVIDEIEYNAIVIEGQNLVDRYKQDEEATEGDEEGDTPSMHVPSTMYLKRFELATGGIIVAAISCVAIVIASNADTILTTIRTYI